MKIRFKGDRGGVLVVSLITTAVLGTALASYMKLVEFQNRAVVRSQYWNGGIPVSEAGIEDALSFLNSVGDGNRATNGWVLKDGSYCMARMLGDARYEVSIDRLMQPNIKSIGYVTEPGSQKEIKRTVLVSTTRSGSLMKGVVAKGTLTMNGGTKVDSFDSSNPAYNTNGKYDPAKAHDMGYAGSVNSYVDTGGGGIWGYVGTGPKGYVNANVGDSSWMASQTGTQPGHYQNDLNISFPAVNPPFQGGGLNPLVNQTLMITNYTYLNSEVTSTTCPSPIPDSGVTTNFQSVTTVTKPAFWPGTLKTNTAWTSATTYPMAGTYIGNVTTRVVVQGNGNGKKTVTYYDYAAISGYTYNTTTYTYNLVTTNATTTLTSYDYVTDSGNYQMNSLSLSGSSQMLIRGNTVLYITGDMAMSGQSQIVIMPGASLTVYLAGNADLSGNGVMNLTQNAAKYTLNGLPGCTSISLGGNAAFTGTIYAPNADLKLSGGGETVYDCVGAIVAKTADFKGHFGFHYDEALGRISGPAQFKVASWNEI